jgi:hypothetical protein
MRGCRGSGAATRTFSISTCLSACWRPSCPAATSSRKRSTSPLAARSCFSRPASAIPSSRTCRSSCTLVASEACSSLRCSESSPSSVNTCMHGEDFMLAWRFSSYSASSCAHPSCSPAPLAVVPGQQTHLTVLQAVRESWLACPHAASSSMHAGGPESSLPRVACASLA